jgi:hypothetical protein
MFQSVCGPWVIMSIHVLTKGYHHMRHCGLFAGSNRAETIHNIRHVTTSRRLGRRDALYRELMTALQKHQFCAGK